MVRVDPGVADIFIKVQINIKLRLLLIGVLDERFCVEIYYLFIVFCKKVLITLIKNDFFHKFEARINNYIVSLKLNIISQPQNVLIVREVRMHLVDSQLLDPPNVHKEELGIIREVNFNLRVDFLLEMYFV